MQSEYDQGSIEPALPDFLKRLLNVLDPELDLLRGVFLVSNLEFRLRNIETDNFLDFNSIFLEFLEE